MAAMNTTAMKTTGALPMMFAIAGLLVTACSSPIKDRHGSLVLPADNYQADITKGAQEYGKFCAACHGKEARGTTQGPPLVNKIYRSDHHSDMSFYKAAQMGTYQHHWHFGNMPAVNGITPEQVANIIAYVRDKQRKAGIE
jgi:mono/diheme cytochrome c family protein